MGVGGVRWARGSLAVLRRSGGKSAGSHWSHSRQPYGLTVQVRLLGAGRIIGLGLRVPSSPSPACCTALRNWTELLNLTHHAARLVQPNFTRQPVRAPSLEPQLARSISRRRSPLVQQPKPPDQRNNNSTTKPKMAAAAPLVTDPSLQSVLAAADLARTQSLAILDLLDAHHAADSDPTSQQLALSAQQRKLETHLAQLRGLNRRAVLGVRSTKQETGEARQEIDALHLQLQNLYYEQRHLRGEITGCEEYE